MGSVSENAYTSQTIAGYNASPPPDDGSESTSNKVEWAKTKTKLADPVKTLSESINTAVTNAFAKSVNTDAGVRNQLSGSFGYEWATATIGTDAIAADASAIAVGTEAGATQDTLQTITATGVFSGAQLILRQRSASEEVNIIHATSTAATATDANIFLGSAADTLLDGREKLLSFIYDDQVATATGWYETGSSASKLVQVVNVQDGAVATGTTVLPDDDTIPQNTEGDEYMTLAVTPTNAANTLIIDIVANASSSAATNRMAIALFQDTTADALAAVQHFHGDQAVLKVNAFRHKMTAGTTSSTTFKVRIGGSAAGTTTFNGVSGARKLGGVEASSITIQEVAA